MLNDDMIYEAYRVIGSINNISDKLEKVINTIQGCEFGGDYLITYDALDHAFKLVELDILKSNPNFNKDDDLDLFYGIAKLAMNNNYKNNVIDIHNKLRDPESSYEIERGEFSSVIIIKIKDNITNRLIL